MLKLHNGTTTIDIMTRQYFTFGSTASCHLQEILRSSSAIHCHNSCLTMQDGLTNTSLKGVSHLSVFVYLFRLNSRSDPAQFLHLSTDAKQQAKVNEQRSYVSSRLTAHPDNTWAASVQELLSHAGRQSFINNLS